MVRYTRHALRRMRERGLSLDVVEDTLHSPDDILLDVATGRLIAINYSEGLVVVYEVRGGIFTVVTVIVVSDVGKLVKKREVSGRWRRLK